MTPEIVPLTHEHLADWYGQEGYLPTVKGIAGFVDGKLVAVAGFWLTQGKVIAFCNLRDEARPLRKTMHKTAIDLIETAKKQHKRIIARCDPDEPTAPNWLRRLGFQHEEGDIWSWQISA
ncbi:hypothetical protein WHT83_06225 [Aminobacter sp. P9b]|uniref:hypothetical protein n=1 Tax=unclassified Aminobacter TaxID=2644704 RepID=UPI000D39B5F1|nr:hypothetical protein [Aminobacter sp. MSH1]AWC25595.1 hypothetical protein CO731_05094 [Aminobacter sp. MSH1]